MPGHRWWGNIIEKKMDSVSHWNDENILEWGSVMVMKPMKILQINELFTLTGKLMVH